MIRALDLGIDTNKTTTETSPENPTAYDEEIILWKLRFSLNSQMRIAALKKLPPRSQMSGDGLSELMDIRDMLTQEGDLETIRYINHPHLLKDA